MDPIGSAIVGCGQVADTHAQALSELQASHLVGVYDVSAERTQAFAARYGVRGFTDLEKMLSHPAVQMASICSPHTTHPEMVVACAHAGVHALVEKRMAVDLKGCDLAIARYEYSTAV